MLRSLSGSPNHCHPIGGATLVHTLGSNNCLVGQVQEFSKQASFSNGSIWFVLLGWSADQKNQETVLAFEWF